MSVEQLTDIASKMRQVMRGILSATTDTSELNGACGHACVMLKKALDSFTGYESRMRGGDGRLDGGYFDCRGAGYGHYWLEVDTGDGRYILDITADQFGGPPVLVEPATGSQNYFPGNQQLVDEHYRRLEREIVLSAGGD